MPLTILQVKLDSRSIRNLAQPDVQILSLAGLEEQDIVAVVQLGEFIELVQAGFGVEFGILPAVRKHRGNIV